MIVHNFPIPERVVFGIQLTTSLASSALDFNNTNKVINLCLESTRLLRKVKGCSIISSNEKVSNALVDRKEAVGTTIFPDKKSSTKDVEKGIEEL